jgi:hypothetical protein
LLYKKLKKWLSMRGKYIYIYIIIIIIIKMFGNEEVEEKVWVENYLLVNK